MTNYTQILLRLQCEEPRSISDPASGLFPPTLGLGSNPWARLQHLLSPERNSVIKPAAHLTSTVTLDPRTFNSLFHIHSSQPSYTARDLETEAGLCYWASPLFPVRSHCQTLTVHFLSCLGAQCSEASPASQVSVHRAKTHTVEKGKINSIICLPTINHFKSFCYR